MTFRTILAAGVAACAMGASVPLANAQEEMSWTVDSYESDSPSEPSTIILHYGIPQTDAVGFEAVCGGSGSPGPEAATAPQAIFWYDTETFEEDQDVSVSFSSGSFETELPGKIYGTEAEVGVSGVQVSLQTDAPVWEAMSKGGVLTYAVDGGAAEKLQLSGAREAIQEFKSNCDAIAAGAPLMPVEADASPGAREGTAVALGAAVAADITEDAAASEAMDAALEADQTAPDPETSGSNVVTCENANGIKSLDSASEVTVTFVNRADGHRALMWIGTDGHPVDKAALNEGESVSLPTAQGHAWMITDGPGNCIEMFVVSDAEDMTFEIKVPAPFFGDEED